mmetsp:Transcript_20536/g.31371  ORF Transcript_20536/g.31371 Transcript_20536/m.31371 type:complete len:210 (-) Transcript_20536:3038-3667(-)
MMMSAELFIEHRRHAIGQLRVALAIDDEYMRKEAKRRAQEHLVACGEILRLLPAQARIKRALYETAHAMADLLVMLGDNSSKSYEKLRIIGKGIGFEYRLDGNEAFTFDEFVQFYGDHAITMWEKCPILIPSRRYTKTQLMLIGASVLKRYEEPPEDIQHYISLRSKEYNHNEQVVPTNSLTHPTKYKEYLSHLTTSEDPQISSNNQNE